MEKIKPYDNYKPSGISWLGDIPEHWDIKRIKYVFKEQDKRSEDGLEELLSVSHYTGVTKKTDRYKLGEEISNAKTLIGYKKVNKGDLVMNIMLAWNGSLGISRFNGITSPAYSVFKSMIGGERFFGYLFRTKNAQQEFKKQSTGIIDSRLRLYPDKFFNIKTLIPPFEEQTAIANFLDYKIAKIDRFIRKKKQLIKLLNEQKAGIINHAVTKGLDANVKMKPSGIEWLGDIPEHWEVNKLKYLAKICNGSDCNKQPEGKYPVYGSGGIFGYNDAFLYDKPSVLLGRKGTIDKPILVTEPFWTVDTAFYTKIKTDTINVLYFFYLCTTIKFNYYSSKTALPSMTQTSLYEVKFAIPKLEEQTTIISHIEKETEKLNKAIATIEKEIALVQEYRTALIAEAVTGKIDVRDYKVPVLEEEDLLYEEIEDEMDMVAEDGEEMEME